MKVLIVSNMYPNKKNPSAGIFVKRFCEELTNLNISYETSVMFKSTSKIKKLINYISFYFLTFMKILFKRYDIIYIHYASHSSIPVLLACKLKKITIYTNVHGSDVVPENARQRKFQKYTEKILKISEKIIVPSKYFSKYVSDKYGISKEKITIYPSSGVNTNIFKCLDTKTIKKIKQKLGINNDFPVFSYVGRISTDKGWDTYIQAVNELIKKNKKANFLLVGSGEESKSCFKLIEDLKLNTKFIILPLQPQEKLVEIFNISDAFIFPTRREGESLGLVAIESMACGTPVIASDFAAPKYYIREGYNGVKFEVKNYKDLSLKMNNFILGKYSKEKMIPNCLETANKFDSNNIRYILSKLFFGEDNE